MNRSCNSMPEHYTTDYQPDRPRSTCSVRSTHCSNRQNTWWCTGHQGPVGKGTAAAEAVAAAAAVETLAAKAAMAVAVAARVSLAVALAGSATS